MTVTAGADRPRAAFAGWAIAVAVYLTAVLHRTSLGVAGLQAAERFHISPGQLSVFVLLQLGVYAAMQIPTGVLVDRYGPRRLLLVAAATMALAQLSFAVAPGYVTALMARALLGCGDALTFVSVLRFAAQHLPSRHYPVIVAVTGMLGALGNVVATVPLAAALHTVGWGPTFAVAAGLSLAAGAGIWLVLPRSTPPRNGPRSARELQTSLGGVGRRVRSAWATPGTRVGFWVHFGCMSSTTAFGVLWGQPYLVAQGFSRGAATEVLLLAAVVAIAVSPAVGILVVRSPVARVPLAIGICLVAVVAWAVLLAGFGGTPPHPLVVAVVAWTALGGPASAIGFSVARDYNRASAVGTASGVVNVGGFVAAIVWAVGVGGLLNLLGGTDAHAFRLAFGFGVLVQLAGTVQMMRWWLRARAHALRAKERGDAIPVPVIRHRWDLVTN